MPAKAMSSATDSHNQTAPLTPLFFVYDSLTCTWYELDAEAWADLVLQGDDQEQSSC